MISKLNEILYNLSITDLILLRNYFLINTDLSINDTIDNISKKILNSIHINNGHMDNEDYVTIQCPKCGGYGNYETRESKYNKCTKCNMSGKLKVKKSEIAPGTKTACNRCKGIGTIDGPSYIYKEIPCPECKGKKYI
jgi:RecJ-like exonuclease